MSLTDIADRMTPSVPIELTYGATPLAAGTKMTTLFGHRAASGGSALDYDAHEVVNVADPDAAQAEVDVLAGEGSEAGQMAAAFVASNAKVGRSNYPAFRLIFLPHDEASFGPNDEGLALVKTERSDMLVSCYPARLDSQRQKLLDLAALISGPDRDLNGQFGSSVSFGCLDNDDVALAIKPNNRAAIIHWLKDTSGSDLAISGDADQGTSYMHDIATSLSGAQVGQTVTGTDIDGGTAKIVSLDSVAKTLTIDGVFHTAGNVTIRVHIAPPQSEAEIAAAGAAAMMSLGQPYRPAQGLPVGGLVPPVKRSDWIMIDPQGLSEQALKAGLSPMTVRPGGVVGLVRTRVTLTVKPDGVTEVKDYIDWQQIQKLFDYREALYQASQNPPFNNNPGGSLLSADLAAKFSDEMLRIAYDFEKAGMFQNVKLLAKYFVAQPSTTSRGRLDARVPVDCVPGLYVLAANIIAVSDAVNFTI